MSLDNLYNMNAAAIPPLEWLKQSVYTYMDFHLKSVKIVDV